MRFTIDLDPSAATGVTVPTVTSVRAGLPESAMDAGAFSAVPEGQAATTEISPQTVPPSSSLNAGASTFTQTPVRAPAPPRGRNVVSIAEPPPPPHADDFGLASVPKKSQATADAGSFKR